VSPNCGQTVNNAMGCEWVESNEWVVQPNTPTNIFGSYCPVNHLTEAS